ncbi:cytochrome c [Burkholderia lata]|uniref:cytochrome c n=1 Tax=Burkholderia lata (strain ATCC 17760 / DSM 23089 / LMG 22485 / NCIMB 9086 / R18194 / 383) TaxID=482957 RepID=UPI001453FBD3|nr:cytochrome c [Burkholderia lata]VWB44507.1 alcohol dehydrogenase [Burkholderia lata]
MGARRKKPAGITFGLLLTFATLVTWIQPAAANAQDADQIARGAYLARAGDCVACHTSRRDQPFAGGLPMETPFGTIYSTNITPDIKHGIGSYSYDDFAAAMRKGVAKDGHLLYPAMPYPSFSKVSDTDIRALYAYFMHGVPPISRPNTETRLHFPFNLRVLLTGWNLLFRPGGAYREDPAQSAAWNRGAYLVQGLAHCGACHTPHGPMGQEKAFDERGTDLYLSGYTLAGWHAPDLRPGHGAGELTRDTIVQLLRTGRSHGNATFGGMSEVVENSTQYFSDADLGAVADYLGSLRPARAPQTPAAPPINANAAAALRSGVAPTSGALLYLNNCNACHRSDGSGAMKAFPALAGNAEVSSDDPSSVIHVILTGSRMPSTRSDPAPLAMPAFGWRLSDLQVAELATFIRESWGNRAGKVTASDVAKVRRQIDPAQLQRIRAAVANEVTDDAARGSTGK